MNAVEMRHIVKTFQGIPAVNDVDFELRQGEIHSLLGENGAGKTTLMKILYGMLRADSGEIRLLGETVDLRSPRDAIARKIGMVHQHFMLAPVLTVAENITVGQEPCRGLRFDHKKAEAAVDELIQRYSFRLDPRRRVSELSVGEQQRVEILKAIYRGADTLILDEPTAVLTPQEVDELFVITRELRETGKSVVIITHKLKETMAIADRTSVLRDGVMIQSGIDVKSSSPAELAGLMVGRSVNLEVVRRAGKPSTPALEVCNLNLSHGGKKLLENINFSLHRGEILGVAGIEGNGQSELIRVLTGLEQPDTPCLTLDGTPLSGEPKDFIARGVGHIPEDRLAAGLVPAQTVSFNMILGYHRLPRFQQKGVYRRGAVVDYTRTWMERYSIKAAGTEMPCSAMSGGNQQKVVVARVFSQEPDVIIVAQPTRGIDIGASEYIHQQLLDLRDAGKAILLLSADLDEVRQLSDRIMVLYEGRVVDTSMADARSETELGLLMLGSQPPERTQA